MIRSLATCGLALGSAALLALAGCSHSSDHQARQPTSPTFESNTGAPWSGYGQGQSSTQDQFGQGPGGQNNAGSNLSTTPDTYNGTQGTDRSNQPGSAGAGQMGTGTMGSTGAGQIGQGSMGSQQGSQQGSSGLGAGAGADTSSTMSERELCDSLTRDAKLRVEDVQGGVALYARPRQGTDISTVREHARQLERQMGSSAAGGTTGGACELFTAARGGANASVNESQGAVRIVITTSDPSQVQQLRRQVRTFVNSSAQSGSSVQGGSHGQGGTHGGQGGTHGGQGSGSQGSGSQGSGSQGSGSQGGGGQGSGSQGGTHGSQGDSQHGNRGTGNQGNTTQDGGGL